MAITQCHECKGEVSTEATACPKCGAPVKKAPAKGNPIVGAVVIGVIAAIWYFWPSSGDQAPKAAPPPDIAAEMLVKPVHDSFLIACFTPELLEQMLGHASRGEKTKMLAMLTSADCIQIPEDQTFKVLAVRGGMLEATNATNLGSSKGMWTVKEAMQPVK